MSPYRNDQDFIFDAGGISLSEVFRKSEEPTYVSDFPRLYRVLALLLRVSRRECCIKLNLSMYRDDQ